MGKAENLKRLMSPRHVAYIGGRAREPAMRMCVDAGFAGPVWPVNPNHDTLAGLKCYASLADLPEPPDAAYVAVPAPATIEAVRELAAMGAGGAVCYAAGFAEVGGDGAALEEALVDAAGELALVGPNCYGILNNIDGLPLWPIGHAHRRVERGAAFVAQSGNISLNVAFNQRSMPFAYIISSGNEAALGTGDYIEALLDNPKVTAIGIYLEAVNDVAGFSRAAACALDQGVPIVAIKAGSSQAGREIAMTHTGSLAGSDAAYDALFDRLGIVRARTPAEMLETLKALSVTGPLAGPRLAVFTCSGGESALIADMAEAAGVALPPPSPAQREALARELPDFAHIGNPLDYNTSLWGARDALERVFTAVMDDGYDAALLVIDYLIGSGERDDVDNALDALIAASRKTGVPAIHGCSLSESVTEEARERLIAAGVAPLQGIDHVIAAVGAAIAYGARRRALDGGTASLVLPPATPMPADTTLLDERESKRRLAEHGLAVPEGRVVDGAGAPAAACEIGFPVALKVLAPHVAHKTEAGALRLGLASEAEVAAAVAEIASALAAGSFLVEAMIGDAVCELIVGVSRDAQLGLVLVVGSGGALVELVEDTRTLLLPADREAIAAAIGSLKAAQLIAGFRGRPAGDVDAAIDAVLAVAAFAEAHRDRLVELDVNPLVVTPRGAVAVDALIRMTGQ